MAATLGSFNPDPDAPVAVDYIIPSRRETSLEGNWARRLLDTELDIGVMRPYVGRDGKTYVTRNIMGGDGKVHRQKTLTRNDTNATLRTLDWIQLDEAVIKAAKPRLRAARDLQEAGLVYALPNGIAKTVLQFQQQSDISGAEVSMEGLRESESDRPVYSTINFPLPLIHKDFSYPLRQILASRTGYSPLDTTTAELAARRVAEQVEQFALGCTSAQLLGRATYTWDASSIYGMMNFPSRISYSLTLPTSPGWTPTDTLNDLLNMKKASQTAFHYGPWMVYTGLYWDPYLDDDYKSTYNDMTLRMRLRKIDGILDVKTVDYIPDQSILLVQMTPDVIRLVKGMDITTVQWESHGGWQLNFKVMCMILPQLRTDFNGNTGIVHGA